MNKLNNKGFAVSGVIYTILIICLTSMLILLGTFSDRKKILDTIKNETFESLNYEVTNESIGAPIVTGGSTTLTGSEDYSIQEPISLLGINYYQYYITDDVADIPIKTSKVSGAVSGNDVSISKTGTYIYFRAISIKGTVGEWSVVSNLYVDNDAPILTSYVNDGGLISFIASDEGGITGWQLSTGYTIPESLFINFTSTTEYTKNFTAPYSGTFYLHLIDSVGNRFVKKIIIKGIYNTVSDSNPGIICGTGTSEDYAGNIVCNVNSVEDFVELSKMSRAGNNFEDKTININYSLDFKLDRSYVNPSTTVFGDINGDGSTTGLKDELNTDKGYSRTGAITGIIDGNNNYIKNVYINRPDENFPSVFGWNAGTLKNIGFTNIDLTGKDYGGIAVGYNTSSGILENINVLDSSLTSTGVQIGGVVGFAYGTAEGITIKNSTIHGYENVGGVFGYAPGGTYSFIYVDNVTVTGDNNIGGLVGNQGTSSITEVLVDADLSGTLNVGGLIGISNNGTVSGIFESGESTGHTVMGSYLNTPNINGYYVEGKTTGLTSGHVTNSNSILESSYNSIDAYGNILDTVNEGSGYYYGHESDLSNIILKYYKT